MRKIYSFLLLTTLLLFGGNAWADTYTLGWGTASGSEGTYTNFAATSGSVTNIVSFSTAKNSSATNPAYNSNSNELRLYYHSGGSGGSITLTPASGITITGFVMTTSTEPNVKYSVDGGAATSVSVSSNTYTVSGISASSSLTIQNVNTTNTQLRIKTIAITYTSSGGSSEPSISLSTNTINVSKDEVDDGTIEVTYDNLTNYLADIIFYEADGETTATYDHSWITAEINATDNTELDYIIDANTGSARKAYMKVYALGDEGEAFSELITVTQASGIDKPSFSTAAGAVTAGTSITLTQAAADEIRYTTDGTDPTKTTGSVYSAAIEITTPTTIKAIAVKGEGVSDVATASYTINVTAPSITPTTGSYLVGVEITISSTGNTIYYNYTNDGSDPASPTNASTEYTGPITLLSGAMKIKAIAYDTYGNPSSVASRTYNGVVPTSLPFSWTGTDTTGKTELFEPIAVIGTLGSDYATSNAPYRLRFDGNGKFVSLFANEKPEALHFTAKLFNAASTGSKMKVQASVDGIEFTDVEEFTIKGAANATFEFTTSNAFASTYRVVKLVMSSKDQNVAVGNIEVVGSTIPVTLNTSGYATVASNFALDFSDDSEFSAWKVTGVSGDVITFSQIDDAVAAGTGVLLKGTASETVNIPVAASGTDISTSNMLVGCPAAKVIEAKTANKANFYVLSGNEFQSLASWTGTIPAGKAYLDVTGSSPAPGALRIEFEENNTTDISNLSNDSNLSNAIKFFENGNLYILREGVVYDVTGRIVK